ncbi:acetyl-CoA carboxylase carboxyltransferase beta subunit [Gossypium australe]|uniref:Acetyl-CoA carboxylase carboxyltransferase beta subunit n=1 Tax=Gossypium australe TaxID=47621 RepID=A0A5B6UQD6_9ROSI|nr:acetyl-CoA carboxylase carboxyltransferase beta subunit [Gossypium australe]
MNICEQCGYHLKMSSSDRIKVSIDPGTWGPMDEDMISLDPIEFQSGEELYKDRIDFYQTTIRLTRAIQTGTGQLNSIPITIRCVLPEEHACTKELFYVSILTSLTTGGVTASFGKRVIEQTLNKTISEGSQAAEYLFHKGLFNLIVPRNPLKGILSELV